MAVTSGNRAFFTVEGGGTFHVQFNPKEIKLDDAAAWKASDEHGRGKPLITYERGDPAVLTFDLIFDQTVRDSSFSAHSVAESVKSLRGMTYPSITETINGKEVHRPPHVQFHWGGFNFDGVMEKISATTLMFDAAGKPLRAKVTCTLKEREEDAGAFSSHGSQVTLSSMSAMVQNASATTTTVQPGQTLTQIAAQNNVSQRSLAQANPHIDPLEPNPGDTVVIPSTPELAAVLEQQARAQVPTNVSPTGDIDPMGSDDGIFGDLGGLGGDDNELSSLFSSSTLLGLVDKGAEKAHEALEVVEDKAHEVADKVVDGAVGVADKVGMGSQVEGLRDDAHGAIDSGEDKGHDAINTGQEAAHSALGDDDFEATYEDPDDAQ